MIGEGKEEILFASFNADLVDTFDDNISGLTPYSKFEVPLSTNMTSLGALKSVKIEPGMSVKLEEMSQTRSTIMKKESRKSMKKRRSSKDPFKKIVHKKRKKKTHKLEEDYENRTTMLAKRSPTVKVEAMSVISAPKVKKVKREFCDINSSKGDK